ncbi:MAG: BMP family ABC transporter substrate-binding protein, partial [Paraburkholderia sp.]|nr:BMP family ABC transporter substrate-binding protein [Paraburkholderia sp.]
EKAIDLADINTAAVTPAAQKALAQKRDDMIAGKFDPFAGPIKGQNGAIKVAAGTSLPDAELLRLNWFVEGVEGTLPK